MDAVELRYSAGAKLRDVLICLALALVLGTVVASLIPRFLPAPAETPGLAGLLAVYAGCWIPGVVIAGLWRWGMRGRVDADAASAAMSARGPAVSLAWDEASEIFRLEPRGVELRGGGERVRLTAEFDGVEAVDPLVGRRAAALDVDLLRSFEGGATLRFHGPLELREAAAGGALLAFLFMPAILIPLGFAAFRLPAARMQGAAVAAVLGAAWLSVMLALALARRARACGWIEVGLDGVRARPAWSIRSARWDDIASVERDGRGRLRLRLKAGGSIVAQSDWSNLGALEAILRRKC